jgi:Holliday junction DNA helicase RuvA
VARDAEGLVVDVGGVGYFLHATPSAACKAEDSEEVVLETYLHVRDDGMQLFGFASGEERRLFEQLLSVAGIGPKVALAIVSAYRPRELCRAIASQDAALFESIPGIGRKLAQRVVLELREKIDPVALLGGDADVHGAGAGLAARIDEGHLVAREALVELGFTVAEAEERLAGVEPGLDPAERVRKVLSAA